MTLLEEELVLWRTKSGELGLAEDLCSHRGTRLSAGVVTADGCIRCPYHGWLFDTTGRCVAIPQLPELSVPRTADISAWCAHEAGGLVWACADPARAKSPLPWFPEAEDGAWHLYAGEPMDWACQSTRQIENFIDIAHFSVLHVDTFGNPDALEVPPHAVTVSPDGRHIDTAFEYPGIDPLASDRGSTVTIAFEYRIELPFAVHLRSAMAGTPYALLVANQPVSASTCRVYWVAATPTDTAMPDEVLEAGEQLVFGPDRAVVQTQRPERLPLDVSAELHLPFDRLAIAYRRALAGLGFPAATPQR